MKVKTRKTVKPNSYVAKDEHWPFSQIDVNCIKMVIKGLWLFNKDLNVSDLEASLSRLLDVYPHLAGRFRPMRNGILMNNEGAELYEEMRRDIKLEELRKMRSPLDKFGAEIKIPAFEKGEAAPLTVTLTHLADGAALGVQCAHACMDGDGFYTMVSNWSKLHNGMEFEKPVFEKPELLMPEKITKEDVLKRVQEKRWYSVGISQLFKFVWQTMTGAMKNVSDPIFVSVDRINALKDELKSQTGREVGTHAVLTALLAKRYFQNNPFKSTTECHSVIVMDVRGRVPELKSSYVGNAMINISTDAFSSDAELKDIALAVDESAKRFAHQSDTLSELVRLNVESSHYKLPFVSFDLKNMSSRHPSVIYVNNLRRFPIYDVDFGGGKPVFAFPNDLLDNVKFWPSSPDKPGTEIYLRGSLRKKIAFIS
jgi:Transferase family.